MDDSVMVFDTLWVVVTVLCIQEPQLVTLEDSRLVVLGVDSDVLLVKAVDVLGLSVLDVELDELGLVEMELDAGVLLAVTDDGP